MLSGQGPASFCVMFSLNSRKLNWLREWILNQINVVSDAGNATLLIGRSSACSPISVSFMVKSIEGL